MIDILSIRKKTDCFNVKNKNNACSEYSRTNSAMFISQQPYELTRSVYLECYSGKPMGRAMVLIKLIGLSSLLSSIAPSEISVNDNEVSCSVVENHLWVSKTPPNPWPHVCTLAFEEKNNLDESKFHCSR